MCGSPRKLSGTPTRTCFSGCTRYSSRPASSLQRRKSNRSSSRPAEEVVSENARSRTCATEPTLIVSRIAGRVRRRTAGQAGAASLQARLYRVMPPAWTAAARDPDGNLIELTELGPAWLDHLKEYRAAGGDLLQVWQ